METIQERELRDYDKAGVIIAATIDRTLDGYVLSIQVNWKQGELAVFSHRNKPRAWQSLDRLVAHLNLVAPKLANVTLEIKPPKV